MKIYDKIQKTKGKKMYQEEANKEKISEVQLTEVQKKITNAKKKLAIVKQIEKLEKEVAKLEKNVSTKEAKIEELAEQL